MPNLSPPSTRVAVGSVMVGGQRLEVTIDTEWARYFQSLNTQVVTTGAAVGQPGAPGTTGAAGAAVSFANSDGDGGVEFIPIRGAQGDAGAAGAALFLLSEPALPDQLPMLPTQMAEAFIAPTLTNSWVNFNTATFNAAGYYKDSGGTVHLRGMVKSGTVGLATPIFTLPAGYRPASEEVFACASNDAFGRVDVTSAGGVALIDGSNLWASLDGITFRAAGTY